MTNTPGPGLERQAGVRNAARAAAIALLLLGIFLLVRGIMGFAEEIGSTSVDGGFGDVFMIGAGGFCLVLALAAVNVGWMAAGARYVAGETMPVVKDSLDHLKGERAPETAARGPYCRACGTRNDETARFCDSCGQSLA